VDAVVCWFAEEIKEGILCASLFIYIRKKVAAKVTARHEALSWPIKHKVHVNARFPYL